MVSFLVTYTGQIGVVVALMCPDATVFRVVLAVLEIHHAEMVAECQRPRSMGVVELCVEVGLQILFAVLIDMPGVLVVHL